MKYIVKRNLLWHLPNIEYGAFDSERNETKTKIKVCHGMFSLYRKETLDEIYKRGFLYDIKNITEDYEITLELKKLKYKVSTDFSIKAYTEVPSTLKELFIQRVRWLKGGIDALKKHGYKKYTSSDINSHILFVFIFILQIFLIINSILVGKLAISYVTYVILTLSFIDSMLRLKYITHKNKVTYLIAFTAILPILYSWFNIFTLLCSYICSLFRIKIGWRN